MPHEEMLKMSFKAYLGAKDRENRKHLSVLKKILDNDFQIDDYSENRDDPHLFIHSEGDVSFGGVRVYFIGGDVAFRIQNEKKQPYGTAYQIPVQEISEDAMVHTDDNDKIAHEVSKAILAELKDFFKQSAAAENDPKKQDPLNSILVKNFNGTDYANRVNNSSSNRY